MRTTDHLIAILKVQYTELDVIYNIKYNKTKVTSVLCDMLREYCNMNFIGRMKNQDFSIMIDEYLITCFYN